MRIQRLIVIAITHFIGIQVHSQENPMQFGQIEQSQLEMSYYVLDSTANALVLGDFGVHRIEYDLNRKSFEYKKYRHTRVKVFNTSGFDHGNYKIMVYKTQRQRNPIREIKAVSYYMDGDQLVTSVLNEEDIFIEEIDKWFVSVNFSVPNLREGCIFEVEYTYQSYHVELVPRWEFQRNIPALFSEFHTFYPDIFNYRREVRGFLPLSIHRNNSRNVYAAPGLSYDEKHELFRIDSIPPFHKEPFMAHESNYLSHVEYELASFNATHVHLREFANNWRQINEMLMQSKYFGGQMRISGSVFKSQAKNIMNIHNDPLRKMISAYNLVQEEMIWNNYNSFIPTSSLREAWNKKTGNAADINLSLVVLLNELGIEAYPVILRTNDFGKIYTWQTTLGKFNYVIACAVINDTTILLDATQKYNPWNLLPDRANNGYGRLISDRIGKSGWVKLDQHETNLSIEQTSIVVKSNGGYDAIINKQMDQSLAHMERERMRKEGSIEKYMASIESEIPDISLLDMKITAQNDFDEPLGIRLHIQKKSMEEEAAELIYLHPLPFNHYKSNPFRLPERLFPVDFAFTRKYSNTVTITLPFGYMVDELPDPIALAMDDRDCFYSYRIMASGQYVQIQIDLEINKSQFSIVEYQYLRDFFAMIVQKQSDLIVIRKIEQDD